MKTDYPKLQTAQAAMYCSKYEQNNQFKKVHLYRRLRPANYLYQQETVRTHAMYGCMISVESYK